MKAKTQKRRFVDIMIIKFHATTQGKLMNGLTNQTSPQK